MKPLASSLARCPLAASIGLCGFLVAAIPMEANAAVFGVGPKGTFIHVRSGDNSTAATVVDLTALGAPPGSTIQIEQLGDLVGAPGEPDDQKSMNAATTNWARGSS